MLGFRDSKITWSTSLNLSTQTGTKSEADFILWYQRRRLLSNNYPVDLVFGESKSFGYDCFEKKDIRKLKSLASLFPGSILVFATMKEQLTKNEKEMISLLALWGRKSLKSRETRAPVIILTATELFASYNLKTTWKEKGDQHAAFAEPAFFHTENLRTLADLTQQLYLGLPSYSTWLEQDLRKRYGKRRSAKS